METMQAAVAYISTGVATVILIGNILCNIYMSICRIPQLRNMFMQVPFLREQAGNDCISNRSLELSENEMTDLDAKLNL